MQTLDQTSRTITLPGRYAATLFELAEAGDKLPLIHKNFKDFLNTVKQYPELQKCLYNATLSKDEQQHIASEVALKLKADALFIHFLELLIQNRRLKYLEEIFTALDQFVDNCNDTNRFTVTSPKSLTPEQQQHLQKILTQKWGNNLHLEYIIDQKLLGGLIVRTGNHVIDLSIANQLYRLASAMKGHA